MRVDPRHLRIALAIAEHGTFNRAATALGTSQPALSKSISQLERVLGVKLFDRGKSGTTITEAGRILLQGAQNIENVLKRTQAEIRANAGGVKGPLSIGATPSMLLGLVPQALASLASAPGPLAVTVVEGLDSVLLPALKMGEIEVLVGPFEVLQSADTSIVEVPLVREDFFVGVPSGHRLSRQSELSVAELSEEPWVLPTAGSSFCRIVDALFLAASVNLPENAIRTNSLTLQETLVATSGRLCLITPTQIAGRKVPFEVIPLARAPSRTIGVRYLASLKLSPLTNVFIQCLRSAAKGLQGVEQTLAGVEKNL